MWLIWFFVCVWALLTGRDTAAICTAIFFAATLIVSPGDGVKVNIKK